LRQFGGEELGDENKKPRPQARVHFGGKKRKWGGRKVIQGLMVWFLVVVGGGWGLVLGVFSQKRGGDGRNGRLGKWLWGQKRNIGREMTVGGSAGGVAVQR